MTTKALVVVTSVTICNALVVAWMLSRRSAPRIGAARVLAVAAVVAGLWLAESASALLLARTYFLVVALAYATLMFLVPLTGAGILLAARSRPVTRPVRVAAWSSFGLVPIFVVATFIEPYRLVTEARDVPLSPTRHHARPIVVGVLADLQCVAVTDREREAVARVMAARPDLVLIPGDLQQAGFDSAERMGRELRALFAPLTAPLGVFYVEGNTESTGEARALLAGTNVRILDDEIVRIRRDDVDLAICGVDLMFRSARAQTALREIAGDPALEDVRIVLAHRPDVIHELSENTRVDLVVAGHTHGGQVRLPFLGPPITLSSVPRHVAAGGLSDLGGRRIYVSRGIGWEHGCAPRVRFLCPPEVTILTLRPGT